MIPCKDCLILPICQNKKELKCGLLFNWLDGEGFDHMTSIWYLPDWERIIQDIPKDGHPTRAGSRWTEYMRTEDGAIIKRSGVDYK